MPWRPVSAESLTVNPPVFSWPENGSGPYTIEVVGAAKTATVYHSKRNWLTLDQVLPVAAYRWRVRDRTGNEYGGWREFFIDKSATQYLIPDSYVLFHKARNAVRPRTLDLALLRRRANDSVYSSILRQARASVGTELPNEPRGKSTLEGHSDAARAEQLTENRLIVFREESRILSYALAGVVTGDRVAIEEARRRALNLAVMDPKGMTGFEAHDQAGRSVAWSLALVFDWLYTEWSSEERKLLLDAITPRMRGMLGNGPYGIDNSFRLDVNPFDSHGVTTLSRSAVICTALAGEDGFFDQCFLDVVPRYLAWPVPWGGSDGGFANGTEYSQWTFLDTEMPVWNLLSTAIGLNKRSHIWARNHGQFLYYFLPPGTPTGLFGDGAENSNRSVWATQAKAYAEYFPSPLANWYAHQYTNENQASLALMLAIGSNREQAPVRLPDGVPLGILMPSIGWAAMHSSLEDPNRTSIYFKSSPYGSFNHSHADQNSFVVHSRGRALAIDSGYYDYYESPHWKDWYKQTRAHNAITVDNGLGQLHDTMIAKGRVTKFEHRAAFDIVTGDATAAFGNILRQAVRSIVYLRPDTALIFDALESAVPRVWEWNLHALSHMKVIDSRSVVIEGGEVRLCVKFLESPDGKFSQTDRFEVEPLGMKPKQWHGRFSTQDRLASANFLVLLDVGCRKPTVMVGREGGRHLVSLAGRQFAFDIRGQVEAL
jgi:hypothetical protein